MSVLATTRDRDQQANIISGEFAFTQEDFRRIASVIHETSGISLAESKATLVYSRLTKRLRLLGLSSFRDYCALIASDEGDDERQAMLMALTTNVTRFYREPHHFDHLKTNVLPPLLREAKQGAKIRLWSAACSTGQEPYSIALTILSLMPDAANYDIKVLATDIDRNVLAQGREAIYNEAAIEPIPADLRQRWVEPLRERGKDVYQMAAAARSLVAFRELNLIGNWPMKGKFHAIFCRNVVIYFEEDTQVKIWKRFVPRLHAGGRLYVGHSERANGVETYLQSDGLTAYRLKDGVRVPENLP